MHGWAKLNVHDCTVEIFMLCFEKSVQRWLPNLYE